MGDLLIFSAGAAAVAITVVVLCGLMNLIAWLFRAEAWPRRQVDATPPRHEEGAAAPGPDPPSGPNPFVQRTWDPNIDSPLFTMPGDDQVFVPKPDPTKLWAPGDVPMPAPIENFGGLSRCDDTHQCAEQCEGWSDGIHVCSLPKGHEGWHHCACGDHEWHVS